ncbi:hypothetical protein [Streptomyces formicae]
MAIAGFRRPLLPGGIPARAYARRRRRLVRVRGRHAPQRDIPEARCRRTYTDS